MVSKCYNIIAGIVYCLNKFLVWSVSMKKFDSLSVSLVFCLGLLLLSVPLSVPGSVMAAPDAGDAWTAPVNVSTTTYTATTSVVDSQAVLDSAGNIHFSFFAYYDQTTNTSHLEIYYINNVGGSWSTPYNVTRNELRDYYTALAIDSLNRLHMTYSNRDQSGEYEIYYTMFDGSTWSSPVNISRKVGNDIANAIAVDSSNHAHVVFWGYNGSEINLFYTNNVAGSWAPVVKISGNVVNCDEPNILIAPNGTVYCCFVASDGSSTDDFEVFISTNAAGSWDVYNVTQDTGYSFYDSFKMDSNQTLHISYQLLTYSGYGIMYTHGAGNTWSTPVNLSLTNNPTDRSRLVLDADDNVHVVFSQEDDSGDADYEIYYTNNTMGSFNTAVNVTASSTNDFRPNFVIDHSGYANIFYFNEYTLGHYNILYQKSSQPVAPAVPADFTMVVIIGVVVAVIIVAGAAIYLLKIRKPK
jgi:hypothetical protein